MLRPKIATTSGFIAILTLSVVAVPIALSRTAFAACTAPSTDYGTVTSSVSIPATATYRIWSRVLAPDTTNNTYLLEVDGSQCYTVGGSNISANTWTWVSHQAGNFNNKINLSLSSGTHNLKFIGNKPGFELDRLVFTSDTSCTPQTASGNECNVTPDTTAPAVDITAPAANATVGGLIAVTASASDAVGVSKVDFYVDSAAKASDTSSPYSFQWDTPLSGNGDHTLIAKAYDAAGNLSTDSIKVTVANGDKQAPSTPGGLSATAKDYSTVDLKWNASTDDKGIRGYNVYRNNVPIAQPTGTTFQDTELFSNTKYSYKVQAVDTSSNTSGFSSTIDVSTPAAADSKAPSAPASVSTVTPGSSQSSSQNSNQNPSQATDNVTTNADASSHQINISWAASNDNIRVKGYYVYRSSNGGEEVRIAEVSGTTFGDGRVEPSTTYTYTVRAFDANGNASAASAPITAKTTAAKKQAGIQGAIHDARTKKAIPGSRAFLTRNDVTMRFTADSKGRYIFYGLERGQYSLSIQANGYASKSQTVTFDTNAVVRDINLKKR